jgi:hypothetical protein
MTTDEALLRERYGRRPRRRAWVPFAVVTAVVGLGWLAWTAVFHGTPEVRSAMVTWTAGDGRTAEARVSIQRRDTDVEAECLLRAQAVDHSVVGETSFTIGPGGRATDTYAVAVRTERPATTVVLVGCRTKDQPIRR